MPKNVLSPVVALSMGDYIITYSILDILKSNDVRRGRNVVRWRRPR
jgi:hypothetical protein